MTGNWRVIFGFAAGDEIAILRIGQHDERKGRNVYDEIYGALGLPAAPTGRRTKPPCCDEQGEGDIDLQFFDRVRGLSDSADA